MSVLPETLLPRTPFESEGRRGRSLDADVVIRRRVQRILLLSRVFESAKKGFSSVLILCNATLHSTEKYGVGGAPRRKLSLAP